MEIICTCPSYTKLQPVNYLPNPHVVSCTYCPTNIGGVEKDVKKLCDYHIKKVPGSCFDVAEMK